LIGLFSSVSIEKTELIGLFSKYTKVNAWAVPSLLSRLVRSWAVLGG